MKFCEYIFDRIGCAYNVPNAARTGVFESCDGENQDFPGVYVQNSVTTTYQQPPESLGPIASVPYTARVPVSSNCASFTSSELYAAAATATSAPNGTDTSGTSVPTNGSTLDARGGVATTGTAASQIA